MDDDQLVEAVAKAVALCPVCEGEGHVADGLDEAACSMPCPSCFGTGYDVRAIIPLVREAEATELRAILENVTDRLEWLVAACQPDEGGPTFRPDSYFVRMARGSIEHARAALGENTDG